MTINFFSKPYELNTPFSSLPAKRPQKFSHPGGCELGERAIDIHIKGLRDLGVWIDDEHDYLFCSTEKLTGKDIIFDFPSVGATENIMLAAVFAEGETRIINAAKEPEISDLQKFLNSAGANITGAGSDTIVIQGVKKLHGAEHTVMPDRIVAGTYLTAAAITKGHIALRDAVYDHLSPIIWKLKETGCEFWQDGDLLHMRAPKRLRPIHRLRTHPHPGLPNINKDVFYI